MMLKQNDPKKLMATAAAIVASMLAFIVIYQVTFYLSRTPLLALMLALFAAVFVYNYVPMELLARLKPEVLHPEARPYRLRPIDCLAEIKGLLLREYFAGKSWIDRAEDREKKELVFVSKFQEQEASDKGVGAVDVELQLLVKAVPVEGNTVVELSYKLSDPRPSVYANEIATATSIAIEYALSSLEETTRCHQ